MRLVGKWRIVVEGDERVFDIFPTNRRGLDYLLLRLFEGEEISASALEHYGIRVRHLGDDAEIITVSSPHDLGCCEEG